MQKFTLALAIATALMSHVAYAQQAEQGEVDDLAIKKKAAPETKAAKTNAAGAGGQAEWTPIDKDAITVIRGLNPAPEGALKDLEQALKGLGSKATYAASVPALINALKDKEIAKLFSELEERESGPHLLLQHIALEKQEGEQFPDLTTKGYLYRPGIGWEEYKGRRLYGVTTLHVLTIAGPITDSVTRDRLAKARVNAVIKRKLPANVQNFLSVLRLVGFAAEAKLPAPVYLYGFGTLTEVDNPSDITVNAYLINPENSAEGRALGKAIELDNEGRSWWDISLGFPVTRVNDLEYAQTGNLIQPRKVDKSTAFAMADLYLRRVDIKNPGASWNPSIVAGAGLKGKLRERLLLGVSTNLPPFQRWAFTRSGWYQLFRPYVGVQFLSTDRPVVNPAPGAPAFEPRTVRKLAIGLNIPVKSSIQRLADPPKQAAETTSAKKAASK